MLRVGLVHLATLETSEATLERALELLHSAHAQGAGVAVLPELFSCGYRFADAAKTPWVLEQLKNFAAETGMTLVAGVLEAAGELHANRARVLGPGGELGCYTKTHLIPAFNEPQTMTPGQELVTFAAGGFRAGVTICFDLRFPELFRSLAVGGVDLFLMPSAWPMSRAYAWELLSKARAAENQAYVIGVNHAEDPFGAASLAIDPMGQEIARVEAEGVTVVELDPDLPKRIRRDFPVLTRRRPDLYGGVLRNFALDEDG